MPFSNERSISLSGTEEQIVNCVSFFLQEIGQVRLNSRVRDLHVPPTFTLSIYLYLHVYMYILSDVNYSKSKISERTP